MRQLQFTDCVEIVGEACQPFSGYKQYVSTGAVAINHISNDDIELVDYDGKPSRANLIAKSGDILFAKMMGTILTKIPRRIFIPLVFVQLERDLPFSRIDAYIIC